MLSAAKELIKKSHKSVGVGKGKLASYNFPAKQNLQIIH